MDSSVNFMVTFRIMNEELDPFEVSNILNIEATMSHKKGDRKTNISKKGKMVNSACSNIGIWALDSVYDKNGSFESHIKQILERLEPVSEKLNELYRRGYVFDFFCSVFAFEGRQAGISLGYETVKRLGELNVNIEICIYSA